MAMQQLSQWSHACSVVIALAFYSSDLSDATYFFDTIRPVLLILLTNLNQGRDY